MWAQLLKVASISKGALVVGVAASAATVSGGVFSNTPSQHEVPNTTPIVSPGPSSLGEPWKSEVPATQLPAATTTPSSQTSSGLPHGAVPGIIKECVERYLALRELGDAAPAADRQAVGEVCKAALAQSGLSSADFWAKFVPETHITAPKTEPEVETPHTTQPSTDIEHWIKECVTKYTRHTSDATETCKKAIQLTGLTSAQFAEKYLGFAPKPTATPTGKPVTPTETPLTKPVTNTAELSQLVTKCLDLHKTITSTGGDTKAASDACRIAIQASGMSSADFWAKFHPTTATN